MHCKVLCWCFGINDSCHDRWKQQSLDQFVTSISLHGQTMEYLRPLSFSSTSDTWSENTWTSTRDIHPHLCTAGTWTVPELSNIQTSLLNTVLLLYYRKEKAIFWTPFVFVMQCRCGPDGNLHRHWSVNLSDRAGWCSGCIWDHPRFTHAQTTHGANRGTFINTFFSSHCAVCMFFYLPYS